MANAKKKKAAKVTTRVIESGDTVVPKKQKTDKKSIKVVPKEAQISKKENKKSTKKGKKKKVFCSGTIYTVFCRSNSIIRCRV